MEQYDFENSQEWKEYLCNIYIPPGQNEEQVLNKYKHRFYKKVVDPAHEIPGSTENEPKVAPQPTRTYSSSIPKKTNTPPTFSSGPSTRRNTPITLTRPQQLFLFLSGAVAYSGTCCGFIFPLLYWITESSYFDPAAWYIFTHFCAVLASIAALWADISQLNNFRSRSMSDMFQFFNSNTHYHVALVSLAFIFMPYRFWSRFYVF